VVTVKAFNKTIMENKKLNFGNIKNMLSRDQMKQIRGGSGGGCNVGACNVYSGGVAYPGDCGTNFNGGKCQCQTLYGPYTLPPGQTDGCLA